MATRRNVGLSEKRIVDTIDNQSSSPALATKPNEGIAGVPQNVVAKLLAFSAAMIVLPIGSYFMTLNTLYNGNTTFAGATAAIVANGVLVGYIIAAVKEDQGEKKDQ